MKKLFTVLLMAFVVSAQAQTTLAEKPVAPETLVLKQLNHDFGKIQQGRPVTTFFEVTNVGITIASRAGSRRSISPIVFVSFDGLQLAAMASNAIQIILVL